ncbi:MAG: hypothetical protein NTY09_00190, partial [bacterium]|nr:hypothetical protein [bacterium]
MNTNRIQILILVMLLFIILIGCSKNSGSPVVPDNTGNQTQVSSDSQSDGPLMLGLWNCTMKPGDTDFQIVPLRTAEITLNINKFLNNSVGGFTISELDLSGLSNGRINCTISITHPLAGLDQFHIFDVWGVFMHNGASSFFMSDPTVPTYSGGPDAGKNEAILLNADGYTRWFNKPEFDGTGPAFLEYYPLGFSNLE